MLLHSGGENQMGTNKIRKEQDNILVNTKLKTNAVEMVESCKMNYSNACRVLKLKRDENSWKYIMEWTD